MTWNKHSRLWTPALAAAVGTAVAFAVAIRQGWGFGLASELFALYWAASLYFWGRSGSDIGSVLGRQGDERQHLVALEAARLALLIGIVAIGAVCLIAAAIGYEIWPFEILLVVIGSAYLIGLRAYGMDPDKAPSGQYSVLGFRNDPPGH